MLKKLTPYLIISSLVVLFFFITKKPVEIQNNALTQDADLIVYWGDGCPHCETVKEYIKDNKSDEKIKISLKEVYKDKTNQSEMINIVDTKCSQLKTADGVGVPLAYSVKEGTCFMGDTPIIDWIKSKTNQ